MSKKKKRILRGICFYAGILLLMAVILVPFFFMITVSLKTAKEAIQVPPTILPEKLTLQHYVDIFNTNIFPFLKYFCVRAGGFDFSYFRYYGRICAFKASVSRESDDQQQLLLCIYVFRYSADRAFVQAAVIGRTL